MDIDIDFRSDFNPFDYFTDAVPASRIQNGQLLKHPAGAYLQDIPIDGITKLSAIPYKEAEDLGYFKIDFLHLSLLDHFDNKKDIRQLSQMEPDWHLLNSPKVVSVLFQVHRYYDLMQKIKPTSVDELADVLALIRPSKRQLLNSYLDCPSANIATFRKNILYAKPEDGKYYFKHAHAIAYAVTIVLQLHLIKGNIIDVHK